MTGKEGEEGKAGGQCGLTTTHLAIIAIVAILVIVAAVLISFGKSGGAGYQAATVPPTATTQPAVTGQRTIDPSKIVVPTTIAVSTNGTYIRVQYMGAYTGFYEADGAMHKIWTSGDRLFAVENSSQTVSVSVQKTDRSAKQPLTVEIWKDGTLLKNASTTELFGQVNLTASV